MFKPGEFLSEETANSKALRRKCIRGQQWVKCSSVKWRREQVEDISGRGRKWGATWVELCRTCKYFGFYSEGEDSGSIWVSDMIKVVFKRIIVAAELVKVVDFQWWEQGEQLGYLCSPTCHLWGHKIRMALIFLEMLQNFYVLFKGMYSRTT